MDTESMENRVHDHAFGQDRKNSAEIRALIVSIVTALTMIVEILAGLAFGSMALLADGIHMGSHASALAISVSAYHYARTHAKDGRFNFGTGKVNSLAAFAGATMLALLALIMAGQSAWRLLSPVEIEFDQAILVAVLGLAVNGACLAILGGPRQSHERHDRSDHNFRSACLHVLADALTSIFAIVALVAAKFLGQRWLDPVMGLVAAALVVRWSWGLLVSSARVLLDHQAPAPVRVAIRKAIESGGQDRISDLHVWSVGPGIYAAEIAILSSRPRDAEGYRRLLPKELGLVHVTFETRACPVRV